jgi:hypothetical protein
MDSLALWGDQIMLVSVAGPETSIKAVHACLSSNVQARFDSEVRIQKGRSLSGSGWEYCCPSMQRHPAGYETYKSKLGYNMWHLLALSKADGFMPCLSETALHQALRSPRYSTPFLRGWVTWLAQQMGQSGDERLLHVLDGFQTSAALLSATTDDLDRLVTLGVQEKHLSFPSEAA